MFRTVRHYLNMFKKSASDLPLPPRTSLLGRGVVRAATCGAVCGAIAGLLLGGLSGVFLIGALIGSLVGVAAGLPAVGILVVADLLGRGRRWWVSSVAAVVAGAVPGVLLHAVVDVFGWGLEVTTSFVGATAGLVGLSLWQVRALVSAER